MDIKLFKDILSYDSTSGKEEEFADVLAKAFKTDSNTLEVFEVGDGTRNLFFKWGEPRIVFCSHMDTVPPYIAPTLSDDGTQVWGRGSCDAKGQLFSMFTACKALEEAGQTGFGLLVLAGEETGSWGAKAFSHTQFKAPLVVVGEPTDNCMVSASKGTKSFSVKISGEAFHSGYPEHGKSAVDRFVEFVDALKQCAIPEDELLGPTTWNIGKLVSDNPQNILSPELRFRIYFRTTFASDAFVSELLPSMASQFGWMEVSAHGGDTPMRYMTLDGFPTKTVSFGSDAPQLTGFDKRILCGPGSILVAHRADEHIVIADLEQAVRNYISIFENTKDII